MQVGETAHTQARGGVGQADHPVSGGSGGGGGAAGGQNLASCGYKPSGYEEPGAVGTGLFPAAWYDGLCTASGVFTGPVLVPSVRPVDVARLARGQLGLPAPRIAANPRTAQLVNLPTWLWLDGGWTTVAATASVPGTSVTATARPRSVTWSMGDGTIVTCRGAGTPYRPGRVPRVDPRSASPDCGHIYRRSSAGLPGGRFVVSATVHWSVSWAGAGQAGTFPDLTTTGTARFRVVESQALNIRPAG